MPIAIETIISDLGKVLVDFDNTVFLRKIARYSPYSVQEMWGLKTEFLPALQDFERGRMSPAEFYRSMTRVLKASVGQDFFFARYNDIFTLDKDVTALLRSLRGSHRLILLSNTDVMRYGHITARFPEILFFDDYVLSYEVGAVKPDPAIYRAALKKAQAPPARCLFIDDLPDNIRAAERLGIRAVLCSPQTDLKGDMAQAGVVFPD